jgi:hypothetical protein
MQHCLTDNGHDIDPKNLKIKLEILMKLHRLIFIQVIFLIGEDSMPFIELHPFPAG